MEKLNILMTGGARGIGAGIVQKLTEAGHNIAFCGRKPVAEFADPTSKIEAETGVKARYYQCDVSVPEDRERLLASFEADFGLPDVLVNNAGVAPLVRSDLLDMSMESFERVLRINLEGPFFLTQAVAKKIAANTDGKFHCIVNIGSVSADYASVNRGEYCLSKAGVAMATKLWAARLAELGIAVYEIQPGIIKSDMTACVTEKYDKLIEGGLTLQKRWGFPEDIGKAVAALVAGSLAYSTGQVIRVDGGLSVLRF